MKRFCKHCSEEYDAFRGNKGCCSPPCRFWSKVDKAHGYGPQGDCWLWIGSLESSGYGNFRIGGGQIRSHQYSYLLHYGSVCDSLEVMHVCDVRNCVNPMHLVVGTHLENMADCAIKGRASRSPKVIGIRQWKSRLDNESVRFIRENYIPQHSVFGGRALAERFGVCPQTISEITKGRNWKHI